MKYVRIQNGIVCEAFDALPEFHQEVMATIRGDAPDNVAQGWTFDGAAYAAPVPLAPTQRDYEVAVQAALDSKAQERNYDNIMSACTYVGSAIALFNAEGVALKAWRDQVWEYCYAQFSLVQSGTIAQPTIADFIASLPAFTWPS